MNKYGNIKFGEDVNTNGLSVSIYFSGCDFNCPNCFNKELQNPTFGSDFDNNIKNEIIYYYTKNKKYVKNLAILGGEPLSMYNLYHIKDFLEVFKIRHSDVKIWLWTGYIYEDIIHGDSTMRYEILKYVDVLIDGRFLEEFHHPNLKYRGSINQRIIDVQKSLDDGVVTELSIY